MILLIEDNDSTRETTARILRLEGHVVVTAVDGMEALALLEQERPALILCDLMMPRLDGWSFRRIQRESPHLADIPFVVVSASLNLDDADDELAPAMTLRKPVDIVDIVNCAKRYDAADARPHGPRRRNDY